MRRRAGDDLKHCGGGSQPQVDTGCLHREGAQRQDVHEAPASCSICMALILSGFATRRSENDFPGIWVVASFAGQYRLLRLVEAGE